ncbi:MAG: NHL repeat-containing protein [Candidatus Eremiobacteraeota bacterium]|nr:NHL repeat-containing protein [Candidatus Eremiobacteraeota bacterium]
MGSQAASAGAVESSGEAAAPNASPIPLNAPIGLAEDARGTLYVGNAGSSQILIYNSKNVQQTSETIHDGVSIPAGLAFDKHGNLYVANVGTHEVTAYDPSHKRIAGKTVHTTKSNNYIPSGVRVDSNDNIWVASRDQSDFNIGVVQVFDSAGKVIHTIDQHLEYPVGIVFVGSDAWVCDSTTPSGNALTVLDADGNFVKTVSTPNFTPTYAAKTASGNLLVTDGLSSQIALIDPAGKVLKKTNNKGLDLPYGIALNGTGDFYVANVANNTITEYNASGKLIHTIH